MLRWVWFVYGLSLNQKLIQLDEFFLPCGPKSLVIVQSPVKNLQMHTHRYYFTEQKSRSCSFKFGRSRVRFLVRELTIPKGFHGIAVSVQMYICVYVKFVRCRYISLVGGKRLEKQSEQTIEHGAVVSEELRYKTPDRNLLNLLRHVLFISRECWM